MNEKEILIKEIQDKMSNIKGIMTFINSKLELNSRTKTLGRDLSTPENFAPIRKMFFELLEEYGVLETKLTTLFAA